MSAPLDLAPPATSDGLTGPDRIADRFAVWLVARQVSLSLLLLVGWILVLAASLPGDACYDLANYHIYGPFALLHGKLGLDLAPGQAQGYLPPLNDLPYYLLSRHLPSTRLLNPLLAVPEAVALCLVFLLTLRLAAATTVTARLVVLVSVLFGATGAATLPVLATSMSDMVSCALILAALLLLLRHEAHPGAMPARTVLLAGLLVGLALGLKLTLSYAAVGLVAGLLCWTEQPAGVRLRLAVLVSIGTVLGVAGSVGWWWYRIYDFSGDPLFPIYNNIFHSPLAPWGNFVDIRFLPHNTRDALLYPFLWAIHSLPRVTEPDQPMRDPRIALALLAAVGLLVLGVWKRTLAPGRTRVVAVLFLVGFVLWERQFSILRYLSLLELLSGPMLAMLALAVLRGPVGQTACLNGAMALLFLVASVTIPPHWGRLPRTGGRPLAVTLPQLPGDSLVLLLDAAPLAFLAAYQPPQVRFYGTTNNLTQPWMPTAMAQRIRDGIEAQLRGRPADLWGIERPDRRFGNADDTLRAYALHRAGCQIVTANIVYEPIQLCRLAR